MIHQNSIIEVVEKPTEYVVSVKVPSGCRPEDIRIETDEVFRILIVGSANPHRVSFEQQKVQLQKTMHMEDVSVSFDSNNGVLEVAFAKCAQEEDEMKMELVESLLEPESESAKTIEQLRQELQTIYRRRLEAEDAADQAAEYNASLGDDDQVEEEDEDEETCSLDLQNSIPSVRNEDLPPVSIYGKQNQAHGNGPILSPEFASPCPNVRANSYGLLKSRLEMLDHKMQQESRHTKEYKELQHQRNECIAALERTNGWQLLRQVNHLQVAE